MLLELQAVTKIFGKDQPAVSSVTLSLDSDEVYCLLGGTQSGKTVLVDLAMGLLTPTSGRALVAGINPAAHPIQARERLTFVSASPLLRPTESIVSNMTFFSRMARRGVAPSRQACLDALREVGLPDRLLDQPVRNLPPDAVLFVWLAIALVRESQLIILDDPTRAIGVESARSLQGRLLEFKAKGISSFIATSDAVFASQVADRLAIIQRGRITSRRTREQVLGLSLAQIYLDYLGELPDANTSAIPGAAGW